MDKKAKGGLSIFILLLFLVLCVLWVSFGIRPLLEYNWGSIFVPVIFSLIVALVSWYDFKSPLFALIISIFVLASMIVISIGWNLTLFVVGGISNCIFYVGAWLDDSKNMGVVGVYTFLFLFMAFIISLILINLFIL